MLLVMAGNVRAATDVGRFTEMTRLVVPLGRGGARPGVTVAHDMIRHEVTLDLSGVPRRGVNSLLRQVEVAGGRHRLQRHRGGVQVVIWLPFNNIQAYWQVDNSRRVLRVDIGSGRYLLPEQPRLRVADLLPKKLPGRENIAEAEKAWADGDLSRARRLLRSREHEGGMTGQLACLLLADLEAETGRLRRAGKRAAHCLERAIVSGSSLRVLAALKVQAYGGRLMLDKVPETFRQLGRRPVEHPWLANWLLYEKCRLLLARGHLAEAGHLLVGLLSRAPQRRLAETAGRKLLALALYRVERETAHGVELAADLVDILAAIDPDAVGVEHLVEAAARELLAAGLPLLAADVIVWHLKNSRGSETKPGLLELLTESFLQAGDAFRAEKTLAFLRSTAGRSDDRRLALLAGRICLRQGRRERALAELAVAARGNDFLALAAAELALQARRPGQKEPLEVLAEMLKKQAVALEPRRLADDLLLLGDAAWDEGLREMARTSYRRFVESFPGDERCPMARYRLLRVGGGTATCHSAPERQDDDPWKRAARLLREVASGKGDRP